jgi:uncharacterized protein (TIGR00255 family)
MTIRSMTGYATSSAQADGWVVSVEARSVNHRGLDMSLSVPRECAWLEPKIAELVRQRMHRGRVQIRVELDLGARVRAEGGVRNRDHWAEQAGRDHEVTPLRLD